MWDTTSAVSIQDPITWLEATVEPTIDNIAVNWLVVCNADGSSI